MRLEFNKSHDENSDYYSRSNNMESHAGEKELNDTIECLKSICKLAHRSTEFIKQSRQELASNDEVKNNSSLSFLELKNHVMMNYLSNLVQIMIKKSDIRSIENSEAINRLIEYRAIIEKMRSTQHKLRYQIEKTINMTKNNQNVDEALLLKPNISNLLDDDDEEDEIRESKNDKKSTSSISSKQQSAIYIVPKINPVEYEYEENERRAKKQEQLEKAKKRAASTVLIKEFKDQFDEDAAPEEINELTVGRRKSIKQNLEKQDYEENYFVRLAEKKNKRNIDNDNLLTINTLGDNLTHFQDVSVLNEQDAEAFAERKKNRGQKKHRGVKLPKKIAKKLAKRSKKRLNRKKMNL